MTDEEFKSLVAPTDQHVAWDCDLKCASELITSAMTASCTAGHYEQKYSNYHLMAKIVLYTDEISPVKVKEALM